MNISEIQAELRKIGGQLERLEQELEELKPKKTGVNKESYAKIEYLGAKNPIPNRFLKEAEEHEKKVYMQFLAVAANLEAENTADKLIYICRVTAGAGIKNYGAESIWALGQQFDEKLFIEAAELSLNLKYNLLKDALIITALDGKVTDEESTFIAEAARFMGCNNSDIAVISTMAECIMKDSFDKLDSLNDVYVNSNKWLGVFTDLIPEKWLISTRTKYTPDKYISPDDDFIMLDFGLKCKFENISLSRGEYVAIKTHFTNIKDDNGGIFIDKKLCARKSGILLHLSEKVIYTGSCFDDIEKFNKWYKEKERYNANISKRKQGK